MPTRNPSSDFVSDSPRTCISCLRPASAGSRFCEACAPHATELCPRCAPNVTYGPHRLTPFCQGCRRLYCSTCHPLTCTFQDRVGEVQLIASHVRTEILRVIQNHPPCQNQLHQKEVAAHALAISEASCIILLERYHDWMQENLTYNDRCSADLLRSATPARESPSPEKSARVFASQPGAISLEHPAVARSGWRPQGLVRTKNRLLHARSFGRPASDPPLQCVARSPLPGRDRTRSPSPGRDRSRSPVQDPSRDRSSTRTPSPHRGRSRTRRSRDHHRSPSPCAPRQLSSGRPESSSPKPSSPMHHSRSPSSSPVDRRRRRRTSPSDVSWSPPPQPSSRASSLDSRGALQAVEEEEDDEASPFSQSSQSLVIEHAHPQRGRGRGRGRGKGRGAGRGGGQPTLARRMFKLRATGPFAGLAFPVAVAVNRQNRVFVADRNLCQVREFDLEGTPVPVPTTPDQRNSPIALALRDDQTLFVLYQTLPLLAAVQPPDAPAWEMKLPAKFSDPLDLVFVPRDHVLVRDYGADLAILNRNPPVVGVFKLAGRDLELLYDVDLDAQVVPTGLAFFPGEGGFVVTDKKLAMAYHYTHAGQFVDKHLTNSIQNHAGRSIDPGCTVAYKPVFLPGAGSADAPEVLAIPNSHCANLAIFDADMKRRQQVVRVGRGVVALAYAPAGRLIMIHANKQMITLDL